MVFCRLLPGRRKLKAPVERQVNSNIHKNVGLLQIDLQFHRRRDYGLKRAASFIDLLFYMSRGYG
jgi:hypothetical protein